MAKADRKKRREERKQRREQRRESRKAMIKAYNDLPDIDKENTLPPYQERFNKIWPFVRAVLEFVQSFKFTKEKLDEGIDKVLAIGDQMSNGEITDEQSKEFLEKLGEIWDKVKGVLDLIAEIPFVGDKYDNFVDKFTAVGDWILEGDEDE